MVEYLPSKQNIRVRFPLRTLIKRIMSTGNNKTSKIPENPLDEPSRPALAGNDERRYNSTRVHVHENFGYIKSGSRRNG